ncbi:hypothetical protein LUZ60_013985 [Juncus effusus]|nr:hypothetical protein LUZ60_013985 [Juncus effusus]
MSSYRATYETWPKSTRQSYIKCINLRTQLNFSRNYISSPAKKKKLKKTLNPESQSPAMQAASIYRRLPRLLSRISPSLSRASDASGIELHGGFIPSRSFSFQPNYYPHSILFGKPQCSALNPICSPALVANYSSDSSAPTEAVKDLYEKMAKSVEARTMPPNAYLWSMINSCSNTDDIKLLFQILQKLRIFRLSNLRIHDNFNCHLCMKVTEACARVGAIDYGLKALKKHNVYGLAPTIGSAHHLLMRAKELNDINLMEKVMQALQRNSLPLQPGTADILFSICYNANKWETLNKYAKKFIKAGVKLRRSAFEIWMDFAAKVGDSEAIWNINSLRGSAIKQHTLVTGFACAKAYLLENKPDSAAATIQLLYQHLPEKKKLEVKDELQKLISEWPLEVIKRKKKAEREVFVESLKNNISAMITSILNTGLDVSVDLEKLPQKI